MAEQRRSFRRKRKFCKLCPNPRNPKEEIVLDYKDVKFLKQFISDKGKILPRRVTGTCAKHQRVVAGAVKRARHMGLIPFVK